MYGELAAGNTIGDAVRTAKIAAIKRGAPPRDWAAFVVVGDPMVHVPLTVPRDGPLVPLAITGAAALALIVLYGWMRKRNGAAAA